MKQACHTEPPNNDPRWRVIDNDTPELVEWTGPVCKQCGHAALKDDKQ